MTIERIRGTCHRSGLLGRLTPGTCRDTWKLAPARTEADRQGLLMRPSRVDWDEISWQRLASPGIDGTGSPASDAPRLTGTMAPGLTRPLRRTRVSLPSPPPQTP